ncbi:BURP domain [Sesbania bispinosa]|nr:BURP domain [Sesbania bispinosa]
MRPGVASWSFILLIFLIAQDSGARKIVTTSGRDAQVKELSYDLQQLVTEGLVLTKIMQVDVEMNKKDEDDDHEDKDHKKLKGKYVEEEEDDDHHNDHKKLKKKYVNDDEKKIRKKKGKRVDEDEKMAGKDVHAHKPSHMDHNHMDPELYVFFIPSDLKVGKKMPIYFSWKDSSTSPKFLPREEADQVPFSSKQLPSLLNFFSISKHSPQAKAMKYTLEQCEFEPMEGETKFCATSLESLLDFARYMFGSNAQFKVLTTTHLTNSTVPSFQNYTITEVKKISVPNIIGCHPMPYPIAVYYCHSQEGDTNLYEVLVEGENGGRVQAAAICHMDTSKWDPDHVAFRVLKVEPGTSPVCHFFPSDNLVWVPSPAAA